GPTVIDSAANLFFDGMSIVDIGGGNARAAWSVAGSTDVDTLFATVTNAAALSGPLHSFRRALLASKLAFSGGRPVALVSLAQVPAHNVADVLQGPTLLADFGSNNPRPVATWAPRISPENGGRAGGSAPAAVVTDSAGRLHTVGTRTSAIATA